MKKFFTLGFLSIILSSCGNGELDYYEGRHGMFTPKPMNFGYLPDGSDDYSQGVRDGCNSALSIIGQGPMRSNFDDIYLDVNRNVEKEEYNKGWTTGMNYCTYVSDPDPI